MPWCALIFQSLRMIACEARAVSNPRRNRARRASKSTTDEIATKMNFFSPLSFEFLCVEFSLDVCLTSSRIFPVCSRNRAREGE